MDKTFPITTTSGQVWTFIMKSCHTQLCHRKHRGRTFAPYTNFVSTSKLKAADKSGSKSSKENKEGGKLRENVFSFKENTCKVFQAFFSFSFLFSLCLLHSVKFTFPARNPKDRAVVSTGLQKAFHMLNYVAR